MLGPDRGILPGPPTLPEEFFYAAACSVGRPDLAVANFAGNSVTVLTNRGNGGFVRSDYSAVDGPNSLAPADYTGDGRPDLAVVGNRSSTVLILKNSGTGSFSSGVTLATGSGPQSLAAADFSGDSVTDMVVANTSGGSVSVFDGKGDGTFLAKVDFNANAKPAFVKAGDLNGDGALDLVTANPNNATISTWLNQKQAGQANITVTSPNTWNVLDPKKDGTGTWPITWQSSGAAGDVKVELSRDGGTSWETLFASTANDGTESWLVSGRATPSARIRVSSVNNPSVSDTSDADFALIGPYYKGFAGGYCTEYAARQFDMIAPSPGVDWSGNAQNWYANAAGSWKETSSWLLAKPGSLAVWKSGTFGHVAVFRGFKDALGNVSASPIGAKSLMFDEQNWSTTILDSANAITTNFGKVTSVTLPVTNLWRGSYQLLGFILPQRK